MGHIFQINNNNNLIFIIISFEDCIKFQQYCLLLNQKAYVQNVFHILQICKWLGKWEMSLDFKFSFLDAHNKNNQIQPKNKASLILP